MLSQAMSVTIAMQYNQCNMNQTKLVWMSVEQNVLYIKTYIIHEPVFFSLIVDVMVQLKVEGK